MVRKAHTSTVGLPNSRTDSARAWNDLDTAILAGDEKLLWQAINAIDCREDAIQQAAESIPRLVYQRRGTVKLAELLLVPIVVPGPTNSLLVTENWPVVGTALIQAVDRWFRRTEAAVDVLSYLRPYEWVSEWNPQITRAHLIATVPGQPRAEVTFNACVHKLPHGAAQLAFLAVVATTRKAWIRLPQADAGEDLRLQQVIAGALQEPGLPAAPRVWTPMPMRLALTQGLMYWLGQLHQAAVILGWSLSLEPSNSDVVHLDLSLAADQVPNTRVPIRLCQATSNTAPLTTSKTDPLH